MKSIAILWNSVQHLKEEMIQDLLKFCEVEKMYDFNLGDNYNNFVKDVYKSENMESWKIDNKIINMQNRGNTTVTILELDINKGDIVYHEKKKKNVFSNLENAKTFMRGKYKELIENYYFDIVFHMTDNEREYETCKKVIDTYNEYLNENELEA